MIYEFVENSFAAVILSGAKNLLFLNQLLRLPANR